MPKQTKRAAITQARKDYTKLNRAYHKIGKQAFGKPARSQVHRDYEAVKKARNAAGRKLGKLTGVH